MKWLAKSRKKARRSQRDGNSFAVDKPLRCVYLFGVQQSARIVDILKSGVWIKY